VHGGHRQPGRGDRRPGAAGGDDPEAELVQAASIAARLSRRKRASARSAHFACFSAGGADATSALFAQINQGGSVTSGLKKVTKGEDWDPSKYGKAKPAPVASVPSTPKAATAAATKPPKCECVGGKKWEIENQVKNSSISIDAEVKQLVERAYRRAKDLVTSNIEILHKTAERLLEKENIDGEEFAQIVAEMRASQYLKPDAPGVTVPDQGA
jgi:hypothetical protein